MRSKRSKFQKVKCTRRNEQGTNASTVIRYSVNYTTGISLTYIWHIWYKQKKTWKDLNVSERVGVHRGLDGMVLRFTTTCVISAYHHLSCEF
jgi:hypothetical protein